MELKDKFKVRNVESGVVIECEKWDVGSIKATWQGPQSSYYYDEDVIVRQIQEGTLELIEEEGEKELNLAKQFSFVSKWSDTVYVATYAGNGAGGDYAVTWYNEDGEHFSNTYEPDVVRDHIINGRWIVKQVFVQEEKAAEAAPPETVEFTKVELPPEYDYVFSEPAPGYNITINDIRKFCEDTGSVVEIDEDFYTVHVDTNQTYIVQDEGALTEVISAVRTLSKHRDRG